MGQTASTAASWAFGVSKTSAVACVPVSRLFPRSSRIAAAQDQARSSGIDAPLPACSGLGELRLGRDYIPTFWNLTISDAFGTNGLGSSNNVRQLYGGTRSDNSIGYFLPANLGGFYGNSWPPLPKGGNAGARRPATGWPRRLSSRSVRQPPVPRSSGIHRQTILNGFSSGQRRHSAGGVVAAGRRARYLERRRLLGLRVLQDSGLLQRGQDQGRERGDGLDQRRDPLRPGRSALGLRPQRVQQRQRDSSTKLEQAKATFQYNLSKRTAIYTTASLLQNKDGSRYALPGAPQGQGPAVSAGADSQGLEFGLRHFF